MAAVVGAPRGLLHAHRGRSAASPHHLTKQVEPQLPQRICPTKFAAFFCKLPPPPRFWDTVKALFFEKREAKRAPEAATVYVQSDPIDARCSSFTTVPGHTIAVWMHMWDNIYHLFRDNLSGLLLAL